MSWPWYLAALGWATVASSCVRFHRWDIAAFAALMSLLMMADGIAKEVRQLRIP